LSTLSTIRVGDHQRVSANLIDGGAIRGVKPSWGTTDPRIATIDADGIVTGMRNGSVTIGADFSGQHATWPLDVVSNAAGRWSGETVVVTCLSSGIGFPCTGVRGQTGHVRLELSQLHDQLAGVLTAALFIGQVVGSVRVDQSVTLQGTVKDEEG